MSPQKLFIIEIKGPWDTKFRRFCRFWQILDVSLTGGWAQPQGGRSKTKILEKHYLNPIIKIKILEHKYRNTNIEVHILEHKFQKHKYWTTQIETKNLNTYIEVEISKHKDIRCLTFMTNWKPNNKQIRSVQN